MHNKSILHFIFNFKQLPEQYRLLNQPVLKKKHKQKKNKHKPGDTPSHESQLESLDISVSGVHEKKHKKQRKHEDEKERKKKKKEKKRKKQKHFSDNSVSNVSGSSTSGLLSHNQTL